MKIKNETLKIMAINEEDAKIESDLSSYPPRIKHEHMFWNRARIDCIVNYFHKEI